VLACLPSPTTHAYTAYLPYHTPRACLPPPPSHHHSPAVLRLPCPHPTYTPRLACLRHSRSHHALLLTFATAALTPHLPHYALLHHLHLHFLLPTPRRFSAVGGWRGRTLYGISSPWLHSDDWLPPGSVPRRLTRGFRLHFLLRLHSPCRSATNHYQNMLTVCRLAAVHLCWTLRLTPHRCWRTQRTVCNTSPVDGSRLATALLHGIYLAPLFTRCHLPCWLLPHLVPRSGERKRIHVPCSCIVLLSHNTTMESASISPLDCRTLLNCGAHAVCDARRCCLTLNAFHVYTASPRLVTSVFLSSSLPLKLLQRAVTFCMAGTRGGERSASCQYL